MGALSWFGEKGGGMNWLDIAIVVVGIVSLIMGLRTGLIRMVALVVGVIVGLFLAGLYSAQLGEFLAEYVGASWANWVGFAIILVGVIIAASILGRIARKIASFMLLGFLDTLAGGVLGVVLSTLLLGTLISLAGTFPFFNLDKAIAESNLAPVILKAMPLVLGLLPDEFDKVKDLVGM